ncbi:hypothetical protein TruAng_003383 [Truncatella angustata]|nr:hypothetical protein TruAng_003383 [Truncatella angustata]
MTLDRSHSYLVLWGDGYGVADEKFEEALGRSRRARASTLRYLVSICKTLTGRLYPSLAKIQQAHITIKVEELAATTEKVKHLIQQDGRHDSDSDTDSDDCSDAGSLDWDDLAEDLNTDTQCLLDLGSRFSEETVGHVLPGRAVTPNLLGPWSPSGIFTDQIQRSYPSCDTGLSERLAQANQSRLLRWRQAIGSAVKINIVSSTNDRSEKGATNTFKDAGLGTSLPLGQSPTAMSPYAGTLVSYFGGGAGPIRAPLLPKGATDGLPFTCISCGQTVRFTNTSAWKKHLFSDLQPYICLDNECSSNVASFSTKAAWQTHFELEHNPSSIWSIIKCPICQQQIQGDKLHCTSHLARHMEDIALMVLPPTIAESEGGSDAGSEIEFQQENTNTAFGDRTDTQSSSSQTALSDVNAAEAHKIVENEKLFIDNSWLGKQDLFLFDQTANILVEVHNLDLIGEGSKKKIETTVNNISQDTKAMLPEGREPSNPEDIQQPGGHYVYQPGSELIANAVDTHSAYVPRACICCQKCTGEKLLKKPTVRTMDMPHDPAKSLLCNTLYINHMPVNVHEDLLKQIFSNQPGYKRLCYRAKQDGPMCFIEFENVQSATSALDELDGRPWTNGIDGRINLGYSKNSLGVRLENPTSTLMQTSAKTVLPPLEGRHERLPQHQAILQKQKYVEAVPPNILAKNSGDICPGD